MSADLVGAVRSRLVSILADIKRLPPGSLVLDEDEDFLHSLGMDSIDAVELTLQLDAEFRLDFGADPDDVDGLSSFGSLLDLVLARGDHTALGELDGTSDARR